VAQVSNPRRGRINKEWEVETFSNTPFANGLAVFSSQRKTVVSEAIFLGGQTGGTVIGYATVVAHDRSNPDQGTIGGTQAATLAPQQFVAGFYNAQGGTVFGSVIGQTTFLVRGV